MKLDFSQLSLSPYKYLSLDVFDTAILRSVAEPMHVLNLMESQLVHDEQSSVFYDFAAKRYEAEINLVQKEWAKDRSREVTIENIYTNLVTRCPEFSPFREKLLSLELSVEKKVSVVNPSVYELYQRALSEGLKVIFVSDIYLPLDHMETILRQTGYDQYEQLFISCNIGTNKASGSLFDHVLESIDASADKVLHLGDSLHSDYVQPQAKGMSAKKIPKASDLIDKTRYKSSDLNGSLGNSLTTALIQNHMIGHSSGSAYDVGYEVLGPLCFGFSNWIIEHAKSKGISDLYFLAREGWFLQKAFDIVLSSNEAPGFRSHYLLASRRALMFPLISHHVADDVLGFLLSSKPATLSQYFTIIDIVLTKDRCVEAGFSGPEHLIDPYRNDDDKKKLKQLLDLYQNEITTAAETERLLYLEYLEQLNMDGQRHVGVVDSGWFGSGQPRLAKMIWEKNPDAEIHGFYFALHQNAREKLNSETEGYGYLYHYDDILGDMEEFLELARIIEVFLSAPFESLKKFSKVNGEITPIYMKDNDSPSLDAEIESVQNGAEQFIKDAVATDYGRQFNKPTPAFVNTLLMQFIRAPSSNEAISIGSLPYEENVIAEDVNPMFSNPNKGLIDLFVNPFKFSREFSESNWRAAYYRNLDSSVLKLFLRYTNRYFLKDSPLYNKVKRKAAKFVRKVKPSSR